MRRQEQQEQIVEFQVRLDPSTKQQEQKMQRIDQIMQKLEYLELSQQIQRNPQYPTQHLKEYITLYVQNHKRSQELFNLMCQHNMIAKLFTNGVSRPIYILETFNLLLANTQQVHELVYIFSHPLFHNYLLINVEAILQLSNTNNTNIINPSSSSLNSSVILASHQCIQYYIQLIKTLVTKLQTESIQCTLLKLFCNTKYSYYPLLSNCIILAIKRNIKEDLVRVTAQHCILQLIGIMARKKVGEYYFSSIHMLLFFYQIIHETIEEETTHSLAQDTTIKYLIDLLKAINLSSNQEVKQKSFLLFFTIFSNLALFKFMKNPAPALHLIAKLSSSLSEIDELSEMPAKYLTPVYFIFGKLLFNKYLNNVTLSSIILITEALSQLSQLKEINILKILKNHYQKNPLTPEQIQTEKEHRNSYQQQEKKRQYLFLNESSYKFRNSMIKIKQVLLEQEYSSILKQIQKYNMDNQQFFSLKQNFYKKSSHSNTNSTWLFGIGNIFKKINIFDITTAEYIKRLSHIAAVKYTPEKEIKFLDDVLSPSAVYLYQFLKVKQKEKYLFGQKTEDTEKIEISFNQNRDQFFCSTQFFKVMLNLAEIALAELDRLSGESDRLQTIQKLQQKFHPKLEHLGEIYFILHFRQFFQHSIFQFLCSSSNTKPRIQLTPKLITYFYKLASSLLFQLTEMNRNKLKSEILKLQKELYSILKEKGFEAFCDYLEGEKEKHMVEFNGRQSLLQMQTSLIKFDKRESVDESSKKLSSSNKKKKSIFRSFSKSSSSKDSPKKTSLQSYPLKQHQTLKIVETKMLHLQLLRFLLQTRQTVSNSMKYLQQQKLPLYKIFEQKFIQKYKSLLMNNKDKQLLYESNGIGFNEQVDYQCTLKIKVNYMQLAIFCQLLHQSKLILKCNIKQFSLSQPYIYMQSEKSINQNTLSEQGQKSSKYQYLIHLLPTTNTLGFFTRGKALELLNTVNQIKFGFKETKDSAILDYLNKENQIAN